MKSTVDPISLVKKAQQGDRRALNDLARAVKPRLSQHIQRMTLDEDLAQDLVQETLLAMVNEFQSLRDTERFWPWLSRIALNKVRVHYRANWRKKNGFMPDQLRNGNSNEVKDTLGEVIGREIKEIVLAAMHHLSPEHRAVIALRCYDQLSFPQIADQLGCGEFKARTLFARAKKTLGRNLARNGLSRGSLLGALVIFGKMSATSETAVADIAITPSILGVGLLPTAMATVASQAAVVIMTAAVATVGLPTWTYLEHQAEIRAESKQTTTHPSLDRHVWYYYPPGQDDVVMVHTRHLDRGQFWTWEWLQNEHGIYRRRDDTVTQVNAHLWQEDLSVLRLPTDPPAFSTFLDQCEGISTVAKSAPKQSDGFLVMSGMDEGGVFQRVLPHYDIDDEEALSRPWPAHVERRDERDAIHRQGWAGIRISGEIAGESVRGVGRIPLVMSQYETHSPWLKIKVGGNMLLEDSPHGALLRDGQGKTIRYYRRQSFFQGLTKPWAGLHCIDSVRRDGARQGLPFQTQRNDEDVTVTLSDRDLEIRYHLDMDRDLIRSISMWQADQPIGRLEFNYEESLEAPGSFARAPRSSSPRKYNSWWLSALARGEWK